MPAPLAGQVTVTASAQQLASPNIANPVAWTLKVPRGNANNVMIGPSTVTTANGHIMEPGDVYDFEQRNKSGENVYQMRPSDVWVIGTAGTDKASWFGSP